MESKIEDFNWNLRCFLDVLKNYGNDVGVGDNMTLQLLDKAQETVNELGKSLDLGKSKNADEMIMCSMDSTHFEMRRTIYCRHCEKSFPATRRDYMLHSADGQHHMKLIEHANLEKTRKTNEPATKLLDCDANNNKNIQLSSPAAVKTNKLTSSMDIESLSSIERKQLASAKVTTGDSPNEQKPNSFSNKNKSQLANKMVAGPSQNLFKPQEKEIPKATSMAIPSVFDDEIYEFLETRKKQQNVQPSKPVEPIIKWRQMFASTAMPSTSTNIVENWREKPSSSAAPDVKKTNAAVPFGSIKKTVNGLESLYSQFPHLDPNKVKNPFVATPMPASEPLTNKKLSKTVQPPRKDDGLQKLAEMLNRKNEAQQPQTAPLFGSLFQQTKQTQPNPIPPPNSFQTNNNNQNIDPNMLLTGMYPNNHPLFIDSSLHGPQSNNMMFQNFQNQAMPPGYGLLGAYPSPWSHPASGALLMQQYSTQPRFNPNPTQPQSNPKPTQPQPNSRLAAMKKNNLSSSVVSLPATFNGQTKKQQQEQKKLQDKNRGRSSSAARSDTVKKPHAADANKDNQTKQKSSPSMMTDFFAKDLSARISYISKSNSAFRKNKTAEPLMKQVIALLNKEFNDRVKCHLIGSRAYETAIGDTTPIDIYLDLLESFHKDKSGGMFVNAMADVTKILRESNEWSDFQCTEQTRYGILSATNKRNKLKCHFRFGTGVVVRNSEVIKCLFEAQPVCRQMVICVRLLMQEMQPGEGKWLNQFNGYIVTLMVIFYFQVSKKLPSISSLQAESADREQCGENNVSFSKPKSVVICKDRLRVFLLGLFEFYKNFQYDQKIISPFEGREIDHSIRKSDEKGLSITVNRFKNMMLSAQQKWVSTNLCIQDIFEHKNNAGYSVKNEHIKAFKYFCTKALNALQANGDSVKY